MTTQRTPQQALETYTGLPIGYSPVSTGHIIFTQPNPPMQPPLRSILAHVTMDTAARLPTSWRDGYGKPLTNKRIAEYQREGRYGSGLKLPPLDSAQPCISPGCKTTINTRKCDYGYLPKPGVYCQKCLKGWRFERDKAVEVKRREKELFNEEYV